jgi:hypothetical protein
MDILICHEIGRIEFSGIDTQSHLIRSDMHSQDMSHIFDIIDFDDRKDILAIGIIDEVSDIVLKLRYRHMLFGSNIFELFVNEETGIETKS